MVEALLGLMTPGHLVAVFVATLGGILIGALPGLTATMGLALVTSMTYSMEGTRAILVLICLYVGAIYGGSRSAILLNIPGTPANAATALDGNPMAAAGEGHRALGLATVASVTGSLIGGISLALLAPILADLALGFGSYEYMLLGLFGILVAGKMTAADDPIKGWIAGFLGLAISMIGQEALHAYPRFTFGSLDTLRRHRAHSRHGRSLRRVGASHVADHGPAPARRRQGRRGELPQPARGPLEERRHRHPVGGHRRDDRRDTRGRRGHRRLDLLRGREAGEPDAWRTSARGRGTV